MKCLEDVESILRSGFIYNWSKLCTLRCSIGENKNDRYNFKL